MKRIFVCSPYAGDIDRNVETARKICRLAIKEGYAPFASHLHYPGIVDDFNPEDRAKGITCGLAFMAICDEVWVFVGNGVSPGMRQELDQARKMGKPIVEITDLNRVIK